MRGSGDAYGSGLITTKNSRHVRAYPRLPLLTFVNIMLTWHNLGPGDGTEESMGAPWQKKSRFHPELKSRPQEPQSHPSLLQQKWHRLIRAFVEIEQASVREEIIKFVEEKIRLQRIKNS